LTTNLPPSVEQFKLFVQNNDNLVKEVRAGRTTWQELYEDWTLLGEDHDYWRDSANTNTSTDVAPAEVVNKSVSQEDREDKNDFLNQVNQLFGYFKKLDMNQVQTQIKNLSTALVTVQDVIGQFQSSSKSSGSKSGSSDRKSHPFSFRKD